MQDFEKLGVFYLGRRYDVLSQRGLPEPLLYESRNLVTHGLIMGMTGSGKTGLGCALIEEAALDGIPAIVIDPKGDLGNLLLTFPELRPEDFAPWINEDDARRQGISLDDAARQQAQLWRQGLASWDQNGDRIQRLRAAADFVLYTPGSQAGLPVSILKSFALPPSEVLEDIEWLRERVASTVTGLLGMAGIKADPARSRETILLANLLQNAWSNGQDLDLAGLIQEVQNPSVSRIGVMEVEAFYPAKERFELAMQLNNLLASPGFAAWTQGEPLDVGQLLHTQGGKPRIVIFSIAHLGEAERMFFVSLLLNQVLSWLRTQSGSTSLRALLYMDEIYGYFPPVANPPSKPPLITLLKQARAYGLGVVLATQNPVDLDYKGLANIGSWFIGRLQTERDKARVLDGLQGMAGEQGAQFDGGAMERILTGLGSRVFLMHNVHQDDPEVFETRWTMSYLRGPLARAQIKQLTEEARATSQAGASASSRPTASEPAAKGVTPAPLSRCRPTLPPQVPQFTVPALQAQSVDSTVVYRPRLLGAARIGFTEAKLKLDFVREIVVMTPITDRAVPVDWELAERLDVNIGDLQKDPADALYGPCPQAASQPKNYAGWANDFVTWIQQRQHLPILRSPALGLFSNPAEDEREFRIRMQVAGREARDATAEKLRAKYAPKIAQCQERLRRVEAAQAREAAQATRAKLDTVLSFGSTLLGAFLGRKAVSAGTLGRAASTMRSAGRAMEQSTDVGRAQETVEAVKQQLQELQAQFQAELDALTLASDPLHETLETIELRPARSQIQVRLVALVWVPVT
jgi:hypothetical protein